MLLSAIPAYATIYDLTTSTNGQVTLNISRSLSRGSRGDDVRALQTFLGTKYPEFYSAGVTGYFGVLTEAAVKKFQERNGIESIGIVGPKTRGKLLELSIVVPTTPVATPSTTTYATPYVTPYATPYVTPAPVVTLPPAPNLFPITSKVSPIRISWTYTATADAFQVFRKNITSGQETDYVQIGGVLPGGTSGLYTDTSTYVTRMYEYSVKACIASMCSDYSNAQQVQVLQ